MPNGDKSTVQMRTFRWLTEEERLCVFLKCPLFLQYVLGFDGGTLLAGLKVPPGSGVGARIVVRGLRDGFPKTQAEGARSLVRH